MGILNQGYDLGIVISHLWSHWEGVKFKNLDLDCFFFGLFSDKRYVNWFCYDDEICRY